MDYKKNCTYWFGTKGVMLTFGCTTWPMAKIPPPFFPSKQWANIFFTLPDEASCEITDEFDFPNPRIPSSAPSPDEERSPDCVAPHLWKEHKSIALLTHVKLKDKLGKWLSICILKSEIKKRKSYLKQNRKTFQISLVEEKR